MPGWNPFQGAVPAVGAAEAALLLRLLYRPEEAAALRGLAAEQLASLARLADRLNVQWLLAAAERALQEASDAAGSSTQQIVAAVQLAEELRMDGLRRTALRALIRQLAQNRSHDFFAGLQLAQLSSHSLALVLGGVLAAWSESEGGEHSLHIYGWIDLAGRAEEYVWKARGLTAEHNNAGAEGFELLEHSTLGSPEFVLCGEALRMRMYVDAGGLWLHLLRAPAGAEGDTRPLAARATLLHPTSPGQSRAEVTTSSWGQPGALDSNYGHPFCLIQAESAQEALDAIVEQGFLSEGCLRIRVELVA